MARILLLTLLFIHLGPTVTSMTGPRRDLLCRDRAALVSFASGVSRDPNGTLANWGSADIHVCNWTGVKCNLAKRRVAQLVLNGTGLSGVISPAISNLSFLSVLDLSDNSFHGRIPDELGHLSRLTQLSLSSNLLDGSIPVELGLLHELSYLGLKDNQLNGPIPKPLFCNTSLVYINLSDNSLDGEIPIDMQCRIPELRYLFLWSNRLVGSIPSSLSNSSKLESIDLQLNFLSGGIPPMVFDNMPCLRFVYLSYNNLSIYGGENNFEPFFLSWANNSWLQELEIAGNGLRGEISSSISCLSTELLRLNLEENLLTGPIPSNITNFVNMTYLNLSKNLLNGSIPSNMSQLKRLQRLYLSNNLLSGEIPQSLGETSQLGLLDVSNNMLSGPIPDTLCNLSQLRTLVIHSNQLNGRIPRNLGKCMNLDILDLSRNRLTWRIPTEIAGLRSMKLYLNLSRNFLEGSVPLEMSNLDMILAIDLSCNHLSGIIPPQLGSCSALEYLNLSGNALRGPLPKYIGSLLNLEVLDLSLNQLSGAIPKSLQASSSLNMLNLSHNNFSGVVENEGFFANLSGDSFLGNPNLCGSISGMSACSRKKYHMLVFLLVPLSVAGTSVLLCLIGYPLAVKFRRISQQPFFDQSDDQKEIIKDYPKVSYRQLVGITRGFSETNLIGSGKFGYVYKGILPDQTRIAVKVLHPKDGSEISQSFHRECQVLKRTRHRNLIRIITTCSKPDFKALVLPLMTNGCLESHLYPRNAHSNGLSLVQLVSIMSDVAEGMVYLHHYAPVRVIHCDLKPSNVLLDEDMTALLSDFGIAKLVKGDTDEGTDVLDSSPQHSATRLLCGSVGYIAPEYGLGSPPTIKGDVYSFGVLILEIITGKRPTDVIFQEGLTLHDWVKRHYHNDIELVIKNAEHSPFIYKLCQEEQLRDVLVELIELGLVCTQYHPSMRPIMIDVAREIMIIKQALLHHSASTTEADITYTPPF